MNRSVGTQAPSDERVEEIRKHSLIPLSELDILGLHTAHSDRAYLLSLFAAAPTPAPTKGEDPRDLAISFYYARQPRASIAETHNAADMLLDFVALLRDKGAVR